MLSLMKIVSRIAAIIGIIAFVVGAIVLGVALFDVWKQWFALSANRSAPFPNPIPNTLIGVGVVAVGAFLVGFSLARGERHVNGAAAKPAQTPEAR